MRALVCDECDAGEVAVLTVKQKEVKDGKRDAA